MVSRVFVVMDYVVKHVTGAKYDIVYEDSGTNEVHVVDLNIGLNSQLQEMVGHPRRVDYEHVAFSCYHCLLPSFLLLSVFHTILIKHNINCHLSLCTFRSCVTMLMTSQITVVQNQNLTTLPKSSFPFGLVSFRLLNSFS